MPTVYKEVYEEVNGLLKVGNEFYYKTHLRLLVKGKIINFVYE